MSFLAILTNCAVALFRVIEPSVGQIVGRTKSINRCYQVQFRLLLRKESVFGEKDAFQLHSSSDFANVIANRQQTGVELLYTGCPYGFEGEWQIQTGVLRHHEEKVTFFSF